MLIVLSDWVSTLQAKINVGMALAVKNYYLNKKNLLLFYNGLNSFNFFNLHMSQKFECEYL